MTDDPLSWLLSSENCVMKFILLFIRKLINDEIGVK